MARQGRPKRRPGNRVTLQYRKAIPFQRGSVFRTKSVKISNFMNYGKLELYLFELCGGGHRTYPGGADYPVITYTKYKEDDVERELRTEPWEDFAASVSYILIKRVEA